MIRSILQKFFASGLVPLYITEIAPVHARGGLGTVNQLAVTFGIFSSQILGLDSVLGSEEQWPLLLALGGAIPAGIQVRLLNFVPKHNALQLSDRNSVPDKL